MVTVFADQVPGLPGAMQLYGDALPARLNPSGCGRNMSLFLVMKRYDCSLRQYLREFGPQLSQRTSLVLFTQLLEGVSFLVESGVAHRDIKSDNLLLDLSGGPDFPNLVITDFGCCLSDTYHGLRLPYRTFDTDKGGNAALMAPEVSLARPGAFTNINYSKSDLWSAGTIAYEMFGLENPFYRTDNGRVKIDTRTYNAKDLPVLPDTTPPLVSILIGSILSRDPNKRPTARLAATICQLLLWAPSSWCRGDNPRPPDTQEILQWLLTMTTKVVCESRWGNTKSALFEYTLVATFLATMSIRSVREALRWIQDQELMHY
jgi:PTEN induced putative kinase 1